MENLEEPKHRKGRLIWIKLATLQQPDTPARPELNAYFATREDFSNKFQARFTPNKTEDRSCLSSSKVCQVCQVCQQTHVDWTGSGSCLKVGSNWEKSVESFTLLTNEVAACDDVYGLTTDQT